MSPDMLKMLEHFRKNVPLEDLTEEEHERMIQEEERHGNIDDT